MKTKNLDNVMELNIIKSEMTHYFNPTFFTLLLALIASAYRLSIIDGILHLL
jgi:hypothetical protein